MAKLTRQGVRDLNAVGPKPKTARRKQWTCPPHLPDTQWIGTWYGTIQRLLCRACGATLDEVDSWK